MTGKTARADDAGRDVRRGRSAFDAVTALSEPTRRRVYEAVVAASGPATRDEVANAVSIGRPIAAFHLDALARAGLLDVDYARPPGRRGPGAGRPAKRYRATGCDIALHLPERRYDLAGQILAAGVRDAAGDVDARMATFEAARAKGHELAREHGAEPGGSLESGQRARACDALAAIGYRPDTEEGAVRLRNCPFHAVVDVEPGLVCQMNLRLVEGLLDGLGLDQLTPELVPTPGECCVRIDGDD